MDLSLEQRLLRFLLREERGEARAAREMQAQPIDLRVGDGIDLEGGAALSCGDYDSQRGELRLERDPYRREACSFEPGADYVIDRRPLGLRGRLRDAVRAAFGWPHLASVLAGEHEVAFDEGRRARAIEQLRQTGLNESQIEAGAMAIATESLALVQGPPGTGKTRLLALIVGLLVRHGCRIAVCAFTHRAVDNALLAIRALAPELDVRKLDGSKTDGRERLRAAGIGIVDARRANLPPSGCVVGSTCYQLAKLHDRERFHYTIFDEAGQLPIPHAMPGMLRSKRWLFFGDHRQLPPVVTTARADPVAAASIFEHLHERYGSHLLDVSYRLNDGVCRVVSDTFYGGRLHSADAAASRRMPFVAGGRLDEVLDPEVPVAWLRVDHRQPGQRSNEEANAVADLVEDVVRHHGVAPEQVAVIAPFRAQVRLLRSAIQHKELPGFDRLTIDTVERIQGQEREVVILSLTAGDPDAGSSRGAFHLSVNRLNVALSRARTKAVLVASAHAFGALPQDAAAMRMASLCKGLRDRIPSVDLTAVYVAQ